MCCMVCIFCRDMGLVEWDEGCMSPWLGWREWEEREKRALCEDEEGRATEG